MSLMMFDAPVVVAHAASLTANMAKLQAAVASLGTASCLALPPGLDPPSALAAASFNAQGAMDNAMLQTSVAELAMTAGVTVETAASTTATELASELTMML